MKRRIKTYTAYIDGLLMRAKSGQKKETEDPTDWEALLQDHITQIRFFQHERLIHLLVTALFAVLTMLSVGIALLARFLPMLLVTAALLVLLVPYIGHYYLLENEVQKMYEQYDQIRALMAAGKKQMSFLVKPERIW